MIDVIGKHQASIFLSNADLVPSPTNISNLLNLFNDKGLLPTTFQEIGLQGIKPQHRIRLNSPNNEWVIHFATDRIDIEQNPIDKKGANIKSSEVFTKIVEDFFARIFTLLNKKANRISLNTSGLLENMSAKHLNSLSSKIFNPTPFYRQHIPFEWGTRIVAKKEIVVRENTELINVISNVKRLAGHMINNGKMLKIDRIELQFDLNTIPENSEFRFSNESLPDFFANSLEIINILVCEIEAIING